MSAEEFLVEEFCHFCGTLQAIAGFLPGQRRPKGRTYLCSWCAHGADPDTYKRPSDDDLIIASLAVRDGTATQRQAAIHAKFGLEGVSPDRQKTMLACYEAKRLLQAGDSNGAVRELLSIIKTVHGF